MCGIVGYVGNKAAAAILIDGLKRLEYRGYDSAGLCVQNGKLTTVRSQGMVAALAQKAEKFETAGTCGIAHTRWATHGVPQERNAHPHRDCTGGVAIVHNGIIENERELKAALAAAGHVFSSDTDSEVLAHLIEEALAKEEPLRMAVRTALARVRGTYGLVVLARDVPQTLIAARMGSPLAIGLGMGESFIASDPCALMAHTKDIVYLDDGEIAAVTSEGVDVDGTDKERLRARVTKIDWDLEEATKAGQPHFMIKEILEQPEVVENSMRGRADLLRGRSVLGGLEGVRDRLTAIDRLVIVGCGSAYYAGLTGEYMIEELAGIPVEVELASEFRYRKPLLTTNTAVLAISQSGETADTLEAVREARRKRALTLGLVNVVGSSISRETDAGVYTHAGPETGVASTKAFVSQLTALTLIAVYLGQLRGTLTHGHAVLAALAELPDLVRETLAVRPQIVGIAEHFKAAQGCLFLGRSSHAPIAYEGALKLKEVGYVHAQGYASAEMKHGPIALVEPGYPCVVLCPQDAMFEKNVGNIRELQARGGRVVAVTTYPTAVGKMVQDQIVIPKTHPILQPILSTVPLQLLAYETAVARGYDPDKPRNLAKSVTVE